MKKLFIALGIAVSICSCQQNDNLQVDGDDGKIKLSPNEYISIAYDHPQEISEAQALKIVEGFASTNGRTRADGTSPTVTKKLYLDANLTRGASNQLSAVPIYEIALNYDDDKGFALVSGDERMPCVLAYSEKGEISDTIVNKGAAWMLKGATASLSYNVHKYEQLKDSLREKTLDKIAQKLNLESVTYDNVKELIVVQIGHEMRSINYINPTYGNLWKEIKPLINTTWNQNAPYNQALDPTSYPESIDYSYYGKNPVGCVGTAVSQIVAYYQVLSSAYGLNIFWDLVKANPSVSNYDNESIKQQVANVCKHVALGIGTSWSEAGGSANLGSAHSYLNGLGVTFDAGSNNQGYTMDVGRILASLDSYPMALPSFISGSAEPGTRSTGKSGGHCWILDGYQMRFRPTSARQILKTSDIYIHANFGWSGHEDGFYMVDKNSASLDFLTDYNGFFNQNLRVFPNIRRR